MDSAFLSSNGDLDMHFFVLNFSDKKLVRQEILNSVDFVDGAFGVVDLGEIIQRHFRWLKALPRVVPFYAVKCNPDREILKTLATLKAGFDCASKHEMRLVHDLGVPSDKIIFANPCKMASHIQYAAGTGVQMMTFDSEDELAKIAKIYPAAKLVLRIATDDSKSKCSLSTKFGASLSTSQVLLKTAKRLNLDIIGVSFHVGSGCQEAAAYKNAIANAKKVFDIGTQMGFNMHLLDIGGGFPGYDDTEPTFENMADVINSSLDQYFPSEDSLTIIAEPGRYYATGAVTLAVNVIAKKCFNERDDLTGRAQKRFMYYVSDGVYGSFNCTVFDHVQLRPVPLKPSGPLYNSSIWGPTCDSIDCILKQLQLPELQVGDWIIFENMGAYTTASASTFNGFSPSEMHYVISEFSKQMLFQLRNYVPEEEGDCMTAV